MSECSAAWSAETSVGIVSTPWSSPASGENHTPSVSNDVEGRSSGVVSITLPSATALRWKATTCSDTSMRPWWSSTPATRRAESGITIVVSVSFLACVYQSTVTGLTSAVRVTRSSRVTAYWSPRWR